jgi:predicted Zn-dependent peptidase
VQNETITSDILRETIHTQLIDPGLRVFVLQKPGFQKQYALFATHYGSINTHFTVADADDHITVPEGIAHFLEHKLFEKKDGDVFHKFAALGGFANAYTTYDLTAYLFSCTANFHENLDVLLNFVQEPYFTEASVEKEQGIIEQELRMYEDEPGHRVYLNLLQAMYHNNPVRIDIGGTVESIRKIDKDLLYQCYNTFYHPANMALVIVGDIEPAAVFNQVADNLSRHAYKSLNKLVCEQPYEPPQVAKARVEDRLAISRPRLLMGYKDTIGLEGRNMLRRELATALMWRIALGRSSSLYNELYDTGQIDDRFFTRYTSAPSYAFSLVGGETNQPEQLLTKLQQGLEKIAKTGLAASDLERSRRAVIGQFLDAFNSLEFIASSLVSHYFRGTSFFDYIEVVQELTIDELNQRLKEHVATNQAVVSLLYPYEKGETDEGAE